MKRFIIMAQQVGAPAETEVCQCDSNPEPIVEVLLKKNDLGASSFADLSKRSHCGSASRGMSGHHPTCKCKQCATEHLNAVLRNWLSNRRVPVASHGNAETV